MIFFIDIKKGIFIYRDSQVFSVTGVDFPFKA